MELKNCTRVGDVVKENFRAAQVFAKNNIDFCCGGDISIEQACAKSNVNLKALITELELTVYMTDPDSKYINSLQPDELCDYIEKRHHTYVNENIPFLQHKLEKLCEVHGDNHQELFELQKLFMDAAQNLSAHMKKEELMLFPYIKRMVKARIQKNNDSGEWSMVREYIEQLDEEHRAEGERFAKMAAITSNYKAPSDGCNTFRVTYQVLKDFEQDLHKHIHLENNILFLKAQELENELKSKG